MPKSKSKDPGAPARKKTTNQRKKPARKRPGLGSLLLFWPFYLLGAVTAGASTPVRWLLRSGGFLALCGLYTFIPLAVFYYGRAKQYDIAKVAEMPERSIVLDRRGQELGRIHGEKRDIVTTDRIATEFLQAIIAREDERFYSHHGVDLIGFGRAVLRNLREGGFKEGASTLTMQLARNSYDLQADWLSFSDTLRELDRKFLEMAVTYRIEANYSKDEILQHYVNRIFWGHSIRGIEEASRVYFEKHAKDLTLSEAALLAGIVRGPNAFSPFKDIDDARRERDTTLQRMVEAKVLSQQEADVARAEEIHVRPAWRRVFHDSWPMDMVRTELERILEDEQIEFGGLQITTTIDGLVQGKAEEALDQHLRSFERRTGYPHQTRSQWLNLAKPRPDAAYLQGSVVVVENLTGSIVAIVGGRNADESKFNRATLAKRQVGSTFKPFVYLAAFDKGLRPNTLISDDPLLPGEVRGAPRGWPKNSDGKFNGMQPVSYGMIRSRNTMSVRVGNFAGLDKVAQVARDVGFEDTVQPRPSSFLGTLQASTLELASAYTVFPNRGVRYRPHIISEIRDSQGTVVWNWEQDGIASYEAVRPGSAWTTSRVLREVTERGTGASVKRLGFTKPCGGKTGTTDQCRDAWFVGYTSSLTAAVWVGFDRLKPILSHEYGSTLALPVWAETMKTADRLGYKAQGIDSKLSFYEARLCRESGKRATEACETAGMAYTDSVPVDLLPAENDLCPVHQGAPAVATGKTLKAVPVEDLPRALPVEDPPPRALPVR